MIPTKIFLKCPKNLVMLQLTHYFDTKFHRENTIFPFHHADVSHNLRAKFRLFPWLVEPEFPDQFLETVEGHFDPVVIDLDPPEIGRLGQKMPQKQGLKRPLKVPIIGNLCTKVKLSEMWIRFSSWLGNAQIETEEKCRRWNSQLFCLSLNRWEQEPGVFWSLPFIIWIFSVCFSEF